MSLRPVWISAAYAMLLSPVFAFPSWGQTLERFRVSYGGYNETATPMWVGIEKGIFRKYGIDASMIQVRSGAQSVAALIAREVDGVWPAQSTILSTVQGGIKLGCIASAINRIPRLLVVRKDISSPGADGAGLRTKDSTFLGRTTPRRRIF